MPTSWWWAAGTRACGLPTTFSSEIPGCESCCWRWTYAVAARPDATAASSTAGGTSSRSCAISSVTNAPSPNGITLNKTNTHVYVAITRSQQIWRLPLMAGGTLSKSGVAIQLSGGHAGPDGIEADDEEGLAVCHLGVGVWRFDSNCLPTHLVDAGKQNRLMTNIAYGGPKRATLHITDSLNGEILKAEMPVPGKKMFAHK